MIKTKNLPLRAWLSASTLEEKTYVAKSADTSIPYLYILASGRRHAGYVKAVKILSGMQFVARIRAPNLPTLPDITLEDLHPALKELPKK